MHCSNRKVPKDIPSLEENSRTHCQVLLFRENPTKHTFKYTELGYLLIFSISKSPYVSLSTA